MTPRGDRGYPAPRKPGRKGSFMKNPKRKRKARPISAAAEARIQSGSAANRGNTEWTARDFKRAKPFAETFPALAKSPRGSRPQKRTTKVAVSLRLTREVVAHFKSDGPCWQSRMDAALKKAGGCELHQKLRVG
jgi:uncharacterized protein (DUF4415 family)